MAQADEWVADSRALYDRGGALAGNAAEAALYRQGELPLPSESVNHANRRLVGDVIEFHHGYIGGS